jgi:hypothetical protein
MQLEGVASRLYRVEATQKPDCEAPEIADAKARRDGTKRGAKHT